MSQTANESGPDFSTGLKLSEVPAEGTIAGRVGDDPVLLSRIGGELFAIGATCTHYGGDLGEGLASGTSVRCPLHHACFDLKTGAVHRAPALDPVDRWLVQVEDDRVFVRQKIEHARPLEVIDREARKIVIVGGGAAGLACASELRRRGFEGHVAILSSDPNPPCDRPNLSKDYLAGKAPEEWLWLRGEDWYSDNKVDLHLGLEVDRIDVDMCTIGTKSGESFDYDRLLIATGSEPNRLGLPGFDGPDVLTLRSVADARSIASRAKAGTRAVIVGASFIALEAAAALRQRGVDVHVVSVEEIPLERVFGSEIGRKLQQLHEANGVRFHLGAVLTSYDSGAVELSGGERVLADFVLVGIGVKPRTAVAELAGARVANGVLVDAQMQTSKAGIYAAGDIAAFPDPFTGDPVRVEHWVVAERQGEIAAANMLGETERFQSAPFFWTEQFGVTIRYVGRTSNWDAVTLEGSFDDRSLIARFFAAGVHCATASIGRDRQNLEDELSFEARAQATNTGGSSSEAVPRAGSPQS